MTGGTNNKPPNPKSTKKGGQNGKQIAVVGDVDTVIGFGLTGIKYLTTITANTDNNEIILTIKGYIKMDEIGFIIITPIFLELPDKHGELPDRIDPIKTLIRRAIGMEIIKDKS